MPPHPNLTRTGHESIGELSRLPPGEKALVASSHLMGED